MAAGTLGDGDEDEVISGINVTPLVDVVLVLLIIFMVTATYISKGAVEVELPEAANAGEAVETTLALVLDAEGGLFLNGAPTDEAGLAVEIPKLRDEAGGRGEKLQAIISADKAASHGEVIHLVDVIKGLGVHSFAFNIVREAPAPADPAADGAAPKAR